jgi:ribosomal protein S18 acetylase RimI-like enzyme
MKIIENQKIPTREIRVEVLSEAHIELIKNFKSYEKELVNYLLEDSLKQQKNKICITYLWFHRITNELAGYLTLSNDCVKLTKISEELQRKLNLKGINYKSLPALKIGRLCVDDKFLRRGIGTLMIDFIINSANEISKKAGCRFIVLDAKRNNDSSKDSIHFYKKMGFKLLKERNRKETPMYLDIYPLLEGFNK